ncbi:MAG: LarC family nickel insertion protein [Desulfovibrionaceae bacterium]|nr:LarC family nickel insertion protein [Desulfovibrionaceae bacterium]
MKTLYLDLENGISGDMFLAALCGLGLKLDSFEKKLKQAGLVTELRAAQVTRRHFQGWGLEIEESSPQPLRHLEEMFEAVKALSLTDQVWAHVRHALVRLAEAEALAHGIPLDEVHFHEVGGVDTIVDVAGAFWGLSELGIERVVAGPVPWFEGTAETCHGLISLPAPATLRLLEGKPVAGVWADWEIITPTGALLLDCLVDEFSGFPGGTLLRQSLAFGTNPRGGGLRACLLESLPAETRHADLEAVWILESHLDHLSGEELGHALDVLMDEGALDVLFLTGIGKKGRPAGSLRVICTEESLEHLENVFFRETHTLGIRRRQEMRKTLPRTACQVYLEGVDAPLQGKAYNIGDKKFCKPEFSALKQAALENSTSALELKTRPVLK